MRQGTLIDNGLFTVDDIPAMSQQRSMTNNRLVECVPNFSEGRKMEVIRELAQAISSVETACVLDTHIDPDHNRSVITFVASAEQVVRAAFNVVAAAARLIDMRTHRGVHPRLGATDVLPFVPLQGVLMSECVVSGP